MRRLLLACAVVIVAIGATLGSVRASTTAGWSIVRTPNPVASSLHDGSLGAVSCASPSMCVAVGSSVNDRANQIAIAASWNGERWTSQQTACGARRGRCSAGRGVLRGRQCMHSGRLRAQGLRSGRPACGALEREHMERPTLPCGTRRLAGRHIVRRRIRVHSGRGDQQCRGLDCRSRRAMGWHGVDDRADTGHCRRSLYRAFRRVMLGRCSVHRGRIDVGTWVRHRCRTLERHRMVVGVDGNPE